MSGRNVCRIGTQQIGQSESLEAGFFQEIAPMFCPNIHSL